ncbi:MAG: phosphoribosylformylglycinamidine cyclo-ligase [Leptospira sp.]|nr:phosphoribosylformylglycinamidine cyclo-ligase [Leptospira sp.]
MEDKTISYKDSGVDTEKGAEFVNNIKKMVHSTHNKNVLGGLGGFAAAFDVSFLKDYREPVLLSGTDGVGTKLELARLLNHHTTVGIDLVAMCVNDLLVMGGKPLFFQDYISCGKLNLEKMEAIVSGIVEGCKQSDASLVGGETAEHPGIMHDDEYDLAGFVVGVVEKEQMIDGRMVKQGDRLIGLESSGPHSNGFSLIRKLFLDGKRELPSSPEMIQVLREYAMKPTIIYVPYILELLGKVPVHGMVHITGGGFQENIPRILRNNLSAVIESQNFPILPFFDFMLKEFSVKKEDLYSTFNMGIGYVVVVDPSYVDQTIQELKKTGINSYEIGEIKSGTGVHIH